MRSSKRQKPSRTFIIVTYGLLTLSLFLLAPLAGETGQAKAKWPVPRIKNIILFIGDGMQLEHEIATSLYLSGKQQKLVWQSPMFHRAPCTTWDVTTYNRFALLANQPPYDPASFDPRLGYDPAQGGRWPFPFSKTGQDSYFLTMLPPGPKYPATDSASAATAWATGFKTDEGNIAWLPGDPAGGNLKTIAEEMQKKYSSAFGVVSTVPFSHATPAAHVSHNISRNNYHAIAEEILKVVKPDVVIGGGHPLWATKLDASGVNIGNYMSMALYKEVKSGAIPEYVFVERAAGANGGAALMNGATQAVAQGKRLFGLFGGSGGNFEPPLPQHSPGAPAVVRQTIENPLFEDAVVAALKVLSQDKDGFFAMFEQGDIDWANHANDYPWMVGTTWDLDQAIRAAMEFVRRPGDNVDWSNTMLIVTSDHANSYMRLARDEQGHPVLGKGMLPNGLPGIYDLVTYSNKEHTNELVMLYVHGRGVNEIARRQGKWYPGTQIIDNTQLYEAMADAAGIK
jgi:alkaline phosphatase